MWMGMWLLGVVSGICVSGYPFYGYQNLNSGLQSSSKEVFRYRRNLDEELPPAPVKHRGNKHTVKKHHGKRSLTSILRQTSNKAAVIAQNIVKAFLPSAKQFGINGMRRMVRRQTSLAKLNNSTSTQNDATKDLRMKIPAGYSPPIVKSAFPQPGNPFSFQYPVYRPVSLMNYGYPAMYNPYLYQPYPYNGLYGSYNNPYDFTKRMVLPFNAFTNTFTYPPPQSTPDAGNVHPPLSPINSHESNHLTKAPSFSSPPPMFPIQYPAAIAAYSSLVQQKMSPPSDPSASSNANSNHVNDASTASGISQGLIDLENDVNGFNQAIQYMKEAFIAQGLDGDSELNEKIHNSIDTDVIGDKKDLIKKKKTAKELFDAFKRTIESKERLENKLVNYFTNYVCGDDC